MNGEISLFDFVLLTRRLLRYAREYIASHGGLLPPEYEYSNMVVWHIQSLLCGCWWCFWPPLDGDTMDMHKRYLDSKCSKQCSSEE